MKLLTDELTFLIVAILIGFISLVIIEVIGDAVSKKFPKIDTWFENMSNLEFED